MDIYMSRVLYIVRRGEWCNLIPVHFPCTVALAELFVAMDLIMIDNCVSNMSCVCHGLL